MIVIFLILMEQRLDLQFCSCGHSASVRVFARTKGRDVQPLFSREFRDFGSRILLKGASKAGEGTKSEKEEKV